MVIIPGAEKLVKIASLGDEVKYPRTTIGTMKYAKLETDLRCLVLAEITRIHITSGLVGQIVGQANALMGSPWGIRLYHLLTECYYWRSLLHYYLEQALYALAV